MRVPDDWFVGFHQGLAARFWAAAGAMTIDEDERIVRALLRVGAAGYDVTGVDVSVEAVAMARARGLGARFVEGDLRALPVDGPFDGVVSWGNSFGYVTPADTVRS